MSNDTLHFCTVCNQYIDSQWTSDECPYNCESPTFGELSPFHELHLDSTDVEFEDDTNE